MAQDWMPAGRGCFTGLDWADWIRRDQPADPYLVWADLAGPAGFGRPDDDDLDRKWPILIEFAREDVVVRDPDCGPTTEVPCVVGLLEIPKAYLRERDGAPGQWVLPTKAATARVSPLCIEQLLRSSDVKRFQLGLPRIPQVQLGVSPPPPKIDTGAPGRIVVGVIDDGCPFAHPALLDSQGWPRIRYLWDQNPTRRRACGHWREAEGFGYGEELGPDALDWLATRAPGDTEAPYRESEYGSFRLDPETSSSRPVDADDRPVPMATRLQASHGSGVLGLALGWPPPSRDQVRPLPEALMATPRPARSPADRRESLDRLKELVDAQRTPPDQLERAYADADTADDWDAVFVQLPTRTVADTTGGSLGVHVLDAVRYMVNRALALPPPGSKDARNNQLVINLSWGATAGAHDGSSILEMALDEYLGTKTGLRTWIVLAAGNAHRSDSHAELELEPGRGGSLSWIVGPDNPLESYLEIWIPDQDDVGPVGHPIDVTQQLLIAVRTPDGRQLAGGSRGEAWVLGTPPCASMVFCRRVVQGESGTMVLLAAAPTRPQGPVAQPRRRPAAPHGEWIVELTMRGVAGTGPVFRVHAWCERNDLTFGLHRPQQSRVYADRRFDEPTENDPEVLAYGRQIDAPHSRPHRRPHGLRTTPALSSLAGGPSAKKFHAPMSDSGRIVVVGAHRQLDGEMARYSSGGPTRNFTTERTWAWLTASPDPAADVWRSRPDIDAPGDLGTAVRGLRAIGTRDGAHARISGTSASAAAVTRTIANVQYWIGQGALRERDVGWRPPPNPSELERLFVRKPGPDNDGARATLTPRVDDRFRRGRFRLR